MEQIENKKEKLEWFSKLLIFVALLFIIISFILPSIFTINSTIFEDLSNTEGIGDTISGLMTPFITLSGVLITFLAFYMQFRANQLQRELFNQQLISEKQKFADTLSEQKKESTHNQFENQFYEMIKLHKDNANEISIDFIEIDGVPSQSFNVNKTQYRLFGRKCFDYFLEELMIIYHVAKFSYPLNNKNYWLAEAYRIFFHGLQEHSSISNSNGNDILQAEFENTLIKLRNSHKGSNFQLLKFQFREIETLKETIFRFRMNYNLFEGYSSFLGHYYRHLFQIVKFVSNREFLTYEDKRNYLRILRAQLSNQEQVMLFYNWLSGYGSSWEDSKNKYFTDYRMIHNVYDSLLFEDFSLNHIFNTKSLSYLDIPVILTPHSGHIDPPTGSWFKERKGLTILPFFS